MADKEVIINGKLLVHGQGVKESIESEAADTIVCFDEVLTDGSDVVTYKVEIDRLVTEKRVDYYTLRNTLTKMMKTPGDITIRETIRYKNNKPWTIVKNYHGCVLESKSYEMKADELSAQNLSFICSDMEETTEE